jgi:FKBP-type peptidyl-prolyl cis-trans isomerase SlyD
MGICKDKVVAIDYKLTGEQGQVLDTSEGRQPLSYIHGAGNLIPGLEQALEGKESGDKLNVSLPPEQAYGDRDEKLVQAVPRSAFEGAPELKPGMQFQANTNLGPRLLTIVDVAPEQITVDANHPLAGMPLNFDVTIRDVREATNEEISHGHVHGPGGHHHH